MDIARLLPNMQYLPMSTDIIDLELPVAEVFLMDFSYENAFVRLKNETRWSQKFINMYGRKVPTPRLTAWYGDPGCTYVYSRIQNAPLPWSNILMGIRSRLHDLLEFDFNSVLLNYYRDGQDSIGFHSDDEPELGPRPVIASLSFGAPRTFVFRHKDKSYRDVPIELRDQTLLLMSGETQEHWQHGIEKTNEAGERINLTFRRIIT